MLSIKNHPSAGGFLPDLKILFIISFPITGRIDPTEVG